MANVAVMKRASNLNNYLIKWRYLGSSVQVDRTGNTYFLQPPREVVENLGRLEVF